MSSNRSERKERPRTGGKGGTKDRVRGGRSRRYDATFVGVDAETREFREGGDEDEGG